MLSLTLGRAHGKLRRPIESLLKIIYIQLGETTNFIVEGGRERGRKRGRKGEGKKEREEGKDVGGQIKDWTIQSVN